MWYSLWQVLLQGISGLARVVVGPLGDAVPKPPPKPAKKPPAAAAPPAGDAVGLPDEVNATTDKNATGKSDAKAEPAPVEQAPTPEPLTWSDQAWLSAWMPRFQAAVKGDNWTHFADVSVNSWRTKSKIQNYLNLTPAELSILQPYIALYKISAGGKRNHYSITQLFKDIDKTVKDKGRLEYVSIKAVSIQRLGKYEGEQNLKVSIELFASSYKAFTMYKGGVRLIDFLRRPTWQNRSKDVTVPKDHVMSVTLGWSTPSGQMINQLDTEKVVNKSRVIEFTEGSKVRLDGILLSHDIKFEQDGSMNITLAYQGVLDTITNSPRSNILFSPGGTIYKKLKKKLAKIDKATTEAAKKQFEEDFKTAQDQAIQEAYREIVVNMQKNGNVYYTKVRNMDQLVTPESSVKYTDCYTAPNKVESSPPEVEPNSERIVKFFPLGELIKFFATNALSKSKLEGQIGKHQANMDFYVGNCNYSGVVSGGGTQIYETNMGSIPISLTLFQGWFVKFLSGKRRTQVSLSEFLHRMLRGLVKSAFASFSDIPIPTAKLYRPRFQMHLRKGGKREAILLTAKTTYGDSPIAGVPHFKLGASQAVVKSFSFKRVNIKGYEEAQMSSTSLADTGIPKSLYNVDLEVFGNPHFNNGMIIMVDPRGLGVSWGVENNHLGLGGYYLITRVSLRWSIDGYYTSISAIYNAPLISNKAKLKITGNKFFATSIGGTNFAGTYRVGRVPMDPTPMPAAIGATTGRARDSIPK